MIQRAKRTLLVQNQSLAFLQVEEDQEPRYTAFVRTLAKKSCELEDFRMLVRDPREHGGDLQAAVATYRAKGFNVDRIRFQVGCHNKGVIADGERLMLGSHNITNAGLTANRDASVIIEDRSICDYYRPVFEHDWAALETNPIVPLSRIAAADESTPPGMIRVSLATLMKRA